jgi:cytochrome P450
MSGNLADFEDDRLGFLAAARDQYGGLVRFDARTTIINDARTARTVLMDPRFVVREDFLQRRLTTDQVHQALVMRQLLSPTVRRSRLGPEIATAWAVTRAAIDTRARSAYVVIHNPMSVLEQVTGRTSATMYFTSDGDHLPALVKDLLDALSQVIGNPFALPASWPVPSRLRIRRRHQQLLAAVEPLLKARRQEPEAFADRAGEILAAAAASPEVTVRRIADLLIGALLAAYRVPAAAAAWGLMLLGTNPSVQEQLLREARQLRADLAAGAVTGAATYPTAVAVVLETLRLYPTTWLLSRYAAGPSEVAGHAFPAHHNFLVSPYVIHRDPQNFERPDEFLPDRWLHADAPRRESFYLPFGHGLHRCPGNHLAMNVLVAILLAVVAGWTIETASDEVRPDARTTLVPAGLALRLSRRAE